MKTDWIKVALFLLVGSAIAGCADSDNSGNGAGGSGAGVKKELHITSIAMLNQGADDVNSHAADVSRSALEMDNRSYVEIGPNELGIPCPIYPRIQKMQDGRFIMFYQDNQTGSNSYYAISPDLQSWSGGKQLFTRYTITDHSGAKNERRFTNCNALVLADGTILAVASYRANTNYALLPLDNGIVMSRSVDNGQTWSAPTEIYQGTNWEPCLLQLP
jgi:hypothetical protein